MQVSATADRAPEPADKPARPPARVAARARARAARRPPEARPARQAHRARGEIRRLPATPTRAVDVGVASGAMPARGRRSQRFSPPSESPRCYGDRAAQLERKSETK